MIGVITPLYNGEAYLRKTIESVQKQNEDLIHYICDDCSTDGSFDLLKKLIKGKPNIRILSTKENSGPSAARNLAMQHALKDGVDYIAFLDADDYWYAGHLTEALRRLETNDFVCSKAKYVSETGEKLVSYGMQDTQNFEDLKNGNFLYISSVVTNRVVIEKVGKFDSLADSLEDWDYWLRVYHQGFKMFFNDKTTIKYLVREGSMAEKSKNAKYIVLSKYKPTKLNLGCGDEILNGYVNCDMYGDKADMLFDAAKIPFHNNTIDEVRAYHLIEHFTFKDSFDVLKEWFRVLKPGGRLVLETPDLLSTCEKFVESDEQTRIILYGHFFAWPWIPGQTHYFLFTESQMTWTLKETGFKDITREAPDSVYAKATPPDWNKLYLKMSAVKP